MYRGKMNKTVPLSQYLWTGNSSLMSAKVCILLLGFTSAFRHFCFRSARELHTEMRHQQGFIVIIAGRLTLIAGRISTGLSQTIRYRPSLLATYQSEAVKSNCTVLYIIADSVVSSHIELLSNHLLYRILYWIQWYCQKYRIVTLRIKIVSCCADA